MSGNYKDKDKGGFTLIEAIVSIAIVTVIMSVVLFNYSTFSDNLALSSAAQEMAVTIRQAQTYGLSVKEVTPTGGVFDKAYGVYFDVNDQLNYYLFVDSNGDKKYNGSSELIEKVSLRNGIKVSNVCNETACPPVATVKIMDVTFLRPNPDAKIFFTDSNTPSNFMGKSPLISPFTGYLTGKVVLRSPKGKTLYVTIESTGQVLVGNII